MKEWLKIIPPTTIIIIYLYLCGGLYLIAYWNTFNFDISNIVGIVEIPKSFIFPFIISNIVFLSGWISSQIYLHIHRKKVEQKAATYATKTTFDLEVILDYIFMFTILLTSIFYQHLKYNSLYWAACCTLIPFPLILKFSTLKIVTKLFSSSTLRYYISITLIGVPSLCVLSAKLNSLPIYNNTDIKYVRIANADINATINDSSSLKLLGFLGDKFIISSLDNKKIIVVNQSDTKSIDLIQPSH